MDIDLLTRDNDTIRRTVAELDRTIAVLEILDQQSESLDLMNAVARLKEGRFWLKEIGHAGHFDTPEGDTP